MKEGWDSGADILFAKPGFQAEILFVDKMPVWQAGSLPHYFSAVAHDRNRKTALHFTEARTICPLLVS